MTAPESKPFPFGKLLLGCGGLLLIIVIGGSYWLYKKFEAATIEDPVQVRALAAEILDGMSIPENYSGLGAFDIFGMRMAQILDHETGLWVVVGEMPTEGVLEGQGDKQFEDFMNHNEPTQSKELEKRNFELAAGQSIELTCSEVVQGEETTLRWHGQLADREGSRRWIAFSNDRESFDESAMTAFLGAIPSTK